MPAARCSRPRRCPHSAYAARMPIADDPDRPGGKLLLDAAGGPVARFVASEREGRPLADLIELAAGVREVDAVPSIVAELRGWRVAPRVQLGRALVAAGGRPCRHAHALSRDLVADPAPRAWLEPPVPPGIELTPVDRPAIDLAPAAHAAYPPDHPDFAEIPEPDAPEHELDDILAGRVRGPLLPCSGLAVAADGSVVGAILVNGADGEPPFGGPWVTQLFRHPDARGVGAPLLRRAPALATRDGLPAVGLAVTHDNPAMALYLAHGFRDKLNTLSVELD